MKHIKLLESFNDAVDGQNELTEGISAGNFIEGFVHYIQKTLPKDRFTVSYEHGELTITNDFEESATFRIHSYSSNEGTFYGPNIPQKGSAEE